MAEHSKVAADKAIGFVEIILNALAGSPKKKLFSGILLVIIAFLIYMKNKKSATDNLKLNEKKGDKKVQLELS